jgi:hypothetical protein
MSPAIGLYLRRLLRRRLGHLLLLGHVRHLCARRLRGQLLLQQQLRLHQPLLRLLALQRLAPRQQQRLRRLRRHRTAMQKLRIVR